MYLFSMTTTKRFLITYNDLHMDMDCSDIYILVGCVLRPIDSEVIKRRHPHLLSLAKDEKLGKYTVPTGNRTPGRRVAVHYYTAAPRQLPYRYIHPHDQ